MPQQQLHRLLTTRTDGQVYEEEFSLSDGWAWAPDGKKIAFWQLQTEEVEWYTLYDTLSRQPYAKTSRYPYPKVLLLGWFLSLAWEGAMSIFRLLDLLSVYGISRSKCHQQ